MILIYIQLNFMSPEALSAAIGEIVEVVILNDAMMIDEPPEMAQQQEEQPSLIPEGEVSPPKSVN